MQLIIDTYIDRSGDCRIYTSAQPPKKITELVCFDVRNVMKIGILTDYIVYDVKMLYGHDGSLSNLVKCESVKSKEEFLACERIFSAHTRALSASKVDADCIPLAKLMPRDIINSYMNLRVRVIEELFVALNERVIDRYREMVWPVFLDILKIENAGIRIDEQFVRDQLKRSDLAVHETKFFKSTKELLKDGFVRTIVSPAGSKTARFRSEGGFHAMGVPHGVCRKSIISRFDGGSILSLDFNAIDYRSLVKVVNDPRLNEIYAGARDFHAVTAAQLNDLDPNIRAIAKQMTYTRVYGGSEESLQRQVQLPMEKLKTLLVKLDALFTPITDFRVKLSEKARQDGYLHTPAGHRIEVARDDHDGKIIGLFAQTYSSAVFNRAIHIALSILKDFKSMLIFTVHDELDIDLHPDERHIIDLLREAIENDTGFVVKAKVGRTYSDATD